MSMYVKGAMPIGDNIETTSFFIEVNDVGVLAVWTGLLKDILIKFNFGAADDYRI